MPYVSEDVRQQRILLKFRLEDVPGQNIQSVAERHGWDVDTARDKIIGISEVFGSNTEEAVSFLMNILPGSLT